MKIGTAKRRGNTDLTMAPRATQKTKATLLQGGALRGLEWSEYAVNPGQSCFSCSLGSTLAHPNKAAMTRMSRIPSSVLV